MEQEIIDILRGIGLTEGEAKVYLALVSVGTSTVGNIIEKSGVSSSKVYLILDKLIYKGLATVIVKEGSKLFTASRPNKIMEYLNEEQNKIEKQREQVNKIIPMLDQKYGATGKLPIVEMNKGRKGAENFCNELLESAKTGDNYITLAGEKVSFAMSSFWFPFSNRLSHKKIGMFADYEYWAWHKKDPKIHRRKERKLFYPRVLDKGYRDLPNILTLGDKSIIGGIDEDGQIFSLIIRNRELTKAFKRLLLIVRETGSVPSGFEKKDIDYDKL